MRLVDILREECIVANASFNDKSAALREIADLAKKSPILKDTDTQQILHELHCRMQSVPDFVVGIITVSEGVDFQALDGQKVYLIVFIIAPEGKSDEHIKLLSTTSQTLSVPGMVKHLLAQRTPEALRQSFLQGTHADIDTEGRVSKALFHVFVQDENVFREIIQVLTGIQPGSVIVIGAENTMPYLAKMPLFAGLWRDEPARFSRIILAVFDKRLVNETIRRIERITGHLDGCTNVMVTVQYVHYSNGSLTA